MADLSVKPIGTDIKPMPSMSLGEMINFARGAQQYQQGNITLSLEQQKERERAAITEFLSKPENYQKDGRIDINKINAEITKKAPLTGVEYLSSLTGLSTAQSQAGTSAIALTLEQQKEAERKRIEQYIADKEKGIGKHQTDTGLNVDAATKDILAIAPLTGPDYVSKVSALETANTQAKQAAQNLNQEQRQIIGSALGLMGRLGITNKNAYIAELDDLVLKNPNNPSFAKLVDAYKMTLQTLPEGANLPSLAISAANSLLTVGAQQEAFAPKAGTADTGAATFVTTTRPSMAGEAPTVSVAEKPLVTAQLPPGQLEQPTGRLDINNQPTFFRYGPNGRYLGEFTVSGTPAEAPGGQRPVVTSQAPAAESVARVRPGETPETMTAANNMRMNAADAAQQVPDQIFNNNKIIELADKVITGKGADFIGSLSGGYAALPWTTDNAQNLNELGHYMQLQTASLSQSSGLGGTDAGRSIAGEIAGKKDWTAGAIKSTARINRALSTATKLFNDGMQREFNKTNDPFSARDFQNKWTKTVDINAVRLYDAMINKDNEAIVEIEKQFGGIGSKQYKALRDKTVNLQKLIRGQ